MDYVQVIREEIDKESGSLPESRGQLWNLASKVAPEYLEYNKSGVMEEVRSFVSA